MTIQEAEQIAHDAANAWRADGATESNAERGDASCPDDVRKHCPAGRHPVRNDDGGWSFILDGAMPGARSDSGERVERRD